VTRLCQLAILLALGVPAIAAAAGVAVSALNSATRPQLIDAARAAHKAGDHAKAAALYRRAGEMELGPALGVALALEEEETGAFAESIFHAQQCVREATADGKLVDRDRILRDCQALELRLVPRIAYLVVEVTDRPEGAEIQVAGQGTSKVTLGVPTVVTPGTILVKAKAPGRIVHWENVEVAAGQTKTLKVDLTPLPDGSGTLTPPQKQEIRAHYQRASRDYDLGKFLEAIDDYQVIYEIDGDPVMLFNLAQAYRLAQQPERAIQFYRRYLQRSPAARNREAVEQKIATLDKLLAEHHKAAPDL
jgi:tetratricopeptide (TPR) repeat protein